MSWSTVVTDCWKGFYLTKHMVCNRRFCDCIGNDIASLLYTSSQPGDESDGEVEADEDGDDGATLAQPHRKKAARKV
jgi:hypothetical protein